MTTLDALQETLADEHAAVWLYGVFGGRTSQAATPDLYAMLRQAYDVHRGRRDQLARTVRDLGAEPVAAAVAYELPSPLQSTGDIRSAALVTERRCAAAYASLVAQSVGDQRRWAITALVDAAVRQLAFGGEPEAFPGLEGLSQS
jgi:uncharacterized protein DUF4439